MATRRINDGFKWKMQRDVLNDLMTRCLNGGGIASGAISTKLYIANPIAYCIDGYLYSLAASAAWTFAHPQGSAGYSNVVSNKARMFAVAVNSAGSVFVYAGSVVSAGDTAYIGNDDVPASHCAIALVHVSMASTLSWVWGTNAFESASVTSATIRYFNISMIPQGVIISE
jgi:hypothetical protein